MACSCLPSAVPEGKKKIVEGGVGRRSRALRGLQLLQLPTACHLFVNRYATPIPSTHLLSRIYDMRLSYEYLRSLRTDHRKKKENAVGTYFVIAVNDVRVRFLWTERYLKNLRLGEKRHASGNHHAGKCEMTPGDLPTWTYRRILSPLKITAQKQGCIVA